MTYYGIYRITNLLNGKMYIGKHKTDNLDDGYMGSGTIIKNAIRKYGVQNFRKEWLMFCEDEEEMNDMERVYVDQNWVDRSDTYNLAIGGEGGGVKGHRVSDKNRARLGALYRGIPVSEERKKRISKTLTGRKNPLHSIIMKRKKWFNNGERSVMTETCPAGFVEGRIYPKTISRRK